MPVKRETTAGSMPNEAPTSRFDTTRSGRYEPVPIILVRIIICLNTYVVRCNIGGIIGLGATGVNFYKRRNLAFSRGSCYIFTQ